MVESERKEHFTESPYFKISIFIITIIFFFSGLYHIQGILIPVVFAALLAMLILPVTKKLEKVMSQGWAIFISLLIIIIVIGSFLLLFYYQIISLADDFPLIKQKAVDKFSSFQSYIERQFNVPISKQLDWIQSNYDKAVSVGGNFIKSFLLGFTGGMADFLLVIIYIFFFLLFRIRIKNFILQLFNREQHPHVNSVIEKIKSLTIHYMTGLLLEILCLGALNSIGFLILGVKQAIFFGYLGAVLNLIPYVGAFIGAVLPMFVAFIYKDTAFYPLAVLGVIFITQFIDNNFLTPMIVGSHIRINELATIIVIIIGGALWGLTGMILFLPLLGMFKIICDNVDTLKPLGFLVGEDDKEAEVTGKKENALVRKIKSIFKK